MSGSLIFFSFNLKVAISENGKTDQIIGPNWKAEGTDVEMLMSQQSTKNQYKEILRLLKISNLVILSIFESLRIFL